MKKILLTICLVLMWCSVSFGQATPLAATSSPKVWKNPTVYQYRYTVPTLASGATAVYEIAVFGSSVKIIDVDFDSASLDVDLYLSQIDAQTAKSVETRVSLEEFGTGDRPAIDPTIMHNGDSPQDDVLYMTLINNGAVATGTSAYALITMERL